MQVQETIEAIEKAKKFVEEKKAEFIAKEAEQIALDTKLETAALLAEAFKKEKISEEELKKEFGEEVLQILMPLKKIEEMRKKASNAMNSEIAKKIIMSISKDLRTTIAELVSKTAELEFGKSKEEAKIALEVHALIAYRLGINKLKNDLEDRAFKILEPKKYWEIAKALEQKKGEREKQLDEVKQVLEEKLKGQGINATIQSRAKHIYSIYSEIKNKKTEPNNILDSLGIRIIVDSKKECYDVLGIVHSLWKPLPGRFKDFIAKPKPNNYQSIQTGVIGLEGKPLEIQIRTWEMHRNAESGVASHWRYKGKDEMGKLEKKISWLKEVMDWQKDEQKAKDFLSYIKVDFFENEIFALTPKGEVIELAEGSSPIDFAFAVHSDLGHKIKGAKVNGKLVALNHVLENGDQVEVITGKENQVKSSWLNIAKTQKALTKIRQYLQIRKQEVKPEKRKREYFAKTIQVESPKSRKVKIAKCCTPLPGDEIVGFETTKRKISVHRADCNNLDKWKEKGKQVRVEWNIKGKDLFLVKIKVLAFEKPGILGEILKEFSKNNAEMISANAKTEKNKEVNAEFEIKIKDLKALENTIKSVQKIKGVIEADRA